MSRKLVAAVGLILTVVAVYLLVWPVPVTPVAWQAPVAPDYVGPFARNDRLKALELLPIGDNHGPETIALDAEGRIYAATHEGRIVRLQADGSNPENWLTIGGRPLGIRFDTAGNLLVADALRGLLRIAPDGTLTVLATEADGKPILFANSVDVAADGKVYFSDSSTKFGASQWGGTYPASLLDILEHGGHGRLLVYDPDAKKATALLTGTLVNTACIALIEARRAPSPRAPASAVRIACWSRSVNLGAPRPPVRVAGLTRFPGPQISETRRVWHRRREYGQRDDPEGSRRSLPPSRRPERP
jgi:Strictosidine synthase-like, N-terminal/Strictosidine synthase